MKVRKMPDIFECKKDHLRHYEGKKGRRNSSNILTSTKMEYILFFFFFGIYTFKGAKDYNNLKRKKNRI